MEVAMITVMEGMILGLGTLVVAYLWILNKVQKEAQMIRNMKCQMYGVPSSSGTTTDSNAPSVNQTSKHSD
jgi:hypothetical protein